MRKTLIIIIGNSDMSLIRSIARQLAIPVVLSGIEIRSPHDSSEMEKLLDQIRNEKFDLRLKPAEVLVDRNYPKPKRERNKHQLHPQAKNPRTKR